MSIKLPAPVSDTLPAGDEISEETVEATELLESVVDEKADPDPEVIVKLLKPVDEPIAKFSALKGEQLKAHIDDGGDVYIPAGEHRVYLEANDFELVEETPATAETKATTAETPPAVIETKPIVSETTPEVGEETNRATQPGPKPEPDPLATPPAAVATAAVPVEPTVNSGASGAGQAAPCVPPKKPTPYKRFEANKRDLQDHMCDLMRRLSTLKRETTSARKAVEVATDELQELIDSWESGKYEEGLKAEAAGEKKAATPPDVVPSIPPSNPATVPGQDTPVVALPSESPVPKTMDMTSKLRSEHQAQDRYNAVLEAAPIGELGLQPKLEERLTEAGVTNILRLERLRADISLNKEKWPKGVGEAKITLIENALSSWIARNQKAWEDTPSVDVISRVAPEPTVATPEPASTAATVPTVTLPPHMRTSPATTPPTITLPPTEVTTPATVTPPIDDDVTIDDL